jgi:hypothetical protein
LGEEGDVRAMKTLIKKNTLTEILTTFL